MKLSTYALNIASIGDISFEGRNADLPNKEVFSAVQPLFRKSDILIANLEGPLTKNRDAVPNKCALRGSPNWAEVLYDIGVSFVSLANNHMMDYGEKGLFDTIEALDSAGIIWVGAGGNDTEAAAPKYFSRNGIRAAIFARSAVEVSSPCYSQKNRPGVAWFEQDRLVEQITSIRKDVDLILLLMHWGLEEYAYPSPNQLSLANALLASGVDVIFGHHPHVMQGVRTTKNKFVAFSLGNFLFDEFEWSFSGQDGQMHTNLSALHPANRKGGILKLNCTADGVVNHEFFPTRIETNGHVLTDDTKVRRDEFDTLCRRLDTQGYSLCWKMYAMIMEWSLRIKPLFKGGMSWQRLKKIRPHHFIQLFQRLFKSLKISSEKSTNPYD